MKSIYFHYDPKAHQVSKRMDVKDKDESRFDVFVVKPYPRAYMLRVDEMNVFEAEDWVTTLNNALSYYKPAEKVEDDSD